MNRIFLKEVINLNITTVLFDLDGTLLPMDQDVFVKDYFGRLARKLAPYGYEPKKLIESVWAGTKAMVQNTGAVTNEEAFWTACDAYLGCEASKDKAIHADFYQNEFNEVKGVCGFEPMAAQIVAPILSGFLYDLIGMRIMFFAFGTLFVALSFVTMFFVKHGDARPEAQGALESLAGGDD